MDQYSATSPWPGRVLAGSSRKASGFGRKRAPVLLEHWEFFNAFLRQPARFCAMVPSSASLGRALLEHCELRQASTVVELGPGTGAITRLILDRIGRRTHFLALELDPENTHRLRRSFPVLTVHNDSAENLPHYLPRRGRKKADYIISALPWGNMRPALQDRILAAIVASLRPGGIFTTYAYVHARWLPAARYFRQRLEDHFLQVTTSRIIWKNLPPAFVYRCQ